MVHLDRQHGDEIDRDQAVLFAARERRRSLAGIPELFRTHRYVGASAMAVPVIDTDAVFSLAQRNAPVTFKTAVRITADGSVATEHRGLCFEFGTGQIGTALWVEDNKIGFTAGSTVANNVGAIAVFDSGAELTVGSEYEIVVAIRPGDGRVRLWLNGEERARGTANSGVMTNGWSFAGDGSFASAFSGAVIPEVPATSQGAPDGFEVIEPLSVYIGQVPRHFV